MEAKQACTVSEAIAVEIFDIPEGFCSGIPLQKDFPANTAPVKDVSESEACGQITVELPGRSSGAFATG